jgi:hypothetical protein
VPRWTAFLRHPLVLLIAGFILTGVIGTLIGRYFAVREEAVRASNTRFDASAKAVRDFAVFAHAPPVRALSFSSAVENKASTEDLRGLKLSYDDAYTIWQINLQSVLLSVRRATTPPPDADFTVDSSIWENIIEDHVVRLQDALNLCVNATYHAYLPIARPSIAPCRLSHLVQVTHTCLVTVIDQLEQYVYWDPHRNWLRTRREDWTRGVPEKSFLRKRCDPDQS